MGRFVVGFGLRPKRLGTRPTRHFEDLIHDGLAHALFSEAFFHVEFVNVKSETTLLDTVIAGQDDVADFFIATFNEVRSCEVLVVKKAVESLFVVNQVFTPFVVPIKRLNVLPQGVHLGGKNFD